MAETDGQKLYLKMFFFSRKMGAPIIRMLTSASGSVPGVCMRYL